MRNYKEIIEKLQLNKISLASVEEKEDYDILTFFGGLNGNGCFYYYLEQVSAIISNLGYTLSVTRDTWLIDWINDCPDDRWVLRIGVRTKHDK